MKGNKAISMVKSFYTPNKTKMARYTVMEWIEAMRNDNSLELYIEYYNWLIIDNKELVRHNNYIMKFT